MELKASRQTITRAIKAAEQHIIELSTGRVRLNLKPAEVDEYIAHQYAILRALKAQEAQQ